MTEVRMPPLSETMEEGKIVHWHKAEGDAVAADEPLYDVETDKTTVEVPAPTDGIVQRILVGVGETAPIGAVVAVIARPDNGSSP